MLDRLVPGTRKLSCGNPPAATWWSHDWPCSACSGICCQTVGQPPTPHITWFLQSTLSHGLEGFVKRTVIKRAICPSFGFCQARHLPGGWTAKAWTSNRTKLCFSKDILLALDSSMLWVSPSSELTSSKTMAKVPTKCSSELDHFLS